MSDIAERTVLSVIQEKYDQIFRAERKVADYIIENHDKVTNYNISELARNSGVSEASIIRFCKHLGYNGYYQMKLCLSRDIGRRDGMSDSSDDSIDSLCRYMSNDALQIGQINKKELFLEVVKVLKECSGVYLCAAGNTAVLARYLGFCLERMGKRCVFDLQMEYMISSLNLARENEVLIVISHSGTSKDVVKVMEVARERGVKIIAITAYFFSPVSNLADYLVLSTVRHENQNSFSLYGEMSVAEVLLNLLYKEIEEDVLDKSEMIMSDHKF